MKKISFKKIGEKVTGLWDKDRTKIVFVPQRAWFIILALSFAVLIAVVLASMWLFSAIESEKIFFTEPEVVINVESIRVEEYRETIKLFEGRAENFDDLLENKPAFVDPSR